MISLETNYAGLQLKNPIVVAAGPWSRNGASIQRSIDAGAAAVVTETITLEEVSYRPRPHLFFGTRPEQMFNTTQFSTMSLEQWEQEFECLQKKGCKIIASICGQSPSEMSYLAEKVERMGCDAIEITLSAPVGILNRTRNSSPQEIHDCVRAAVEARIQTQKNTFEGYGVEQFEMLSSNAVVEVRGNYVLFVVNAASSDARKAFLNAI